VLVHDLVLRITAAVIEWADLTERRVNSWQGLKPDDTMRTAAIDLVRELRERVTTITAPHVDTQRPERSVAV
jgi:hypothetical protein